jgi:pimeloyl-ACP methyl ester carboxylesterase
MPTWFGHSIANDIPTAELVAFDNAGHMIPETRTEELAAAVSSFINDRCQ